MYACTSPPVAKLRVMSNHPQDMRLRQLVADACALPARSIARRRVLNQFVQEVQRSQRLFRGNGAKPEHYSDALSATWEYVLNHLESYDPSRAEVMTWINYRLRMNILTIQGKPIRELQALEWENADGTSWSLLDNLESSADAGILLHKFESWQRTYQQQQQAIHIQQRSDLHVHLMIQLRIIQGMTFREISQTYNAPIPTLSSFWQNKCLPELHKFKDDLI
jgi:hypothetical protein